MISDHKYLIESQVSLRKNCLHSELFWSAFSRIWTEYEEILHISPYSVQMRENADQNKSEYGHFLHSLCQMHHHQSEC